MGNILFLSLLAGVGGGAVLFLVVFFRKLSQYHKAAAEFAFFKTGISSEGGFVGEPTDFAQQLIAYWRTCEMYEYHRGKLKKIDRSIRRIVVGWYYDLRKECHDAALRELREIPTFIESSYLFSNPRKSDFSFMKQWNKIEESLQQPKNATLIMLIMERAMDLLNSDFEIILKRQPIGEFDVAVRGVESWLEKHFANTAVLAVRYQLIGTVTEFIQKNSKSIKSAILDEMHRAINTASPNEAGMHKARSIEPLAKLHILQRRPFDEVRAEVVRDLDGFLEQMYMAETGYDERLKILERIQTPSVKNRLIVAAEA